MKKNKTIAYRIRCPKCRKAEMDRFLKACFSCWVEMSPEERRQLQVHAGMVGDNSILIK